MGARPNDESSETEGGGEADETHVWPMLGGLHGVSNIFLSDLKVSMGRESSSLSTDGLEEREEDAELPGEGNANDASW